MSQSAKDHGMSDGEFLEVPQVFGKKPRERWALSDNIVPRRGNN